MKKTRNALITSALSMLLCLSMLIGTSWAWFTDSVTSAGNIIQSGTLDVQMHWAKGTEDPASATYTDAATGAIFNYDKWEPGYIDVKHVKISNTGTLALKYQLNIVANGTVSELADVIDVYFVDPAVQFTDRTALSDNNKIGTLREVIKGLSDGKQGNGYLEAGKSVTVTLALKMQESAGNEYQGLSIGTDFSVQLLATQATAENDSFDNKYDNGATFPELNLSGGITEDVETDAAGKVKTEVVLADETVSALIPAGVQLNAGTNKLTFKVTELAESHANVILGENEELRALDVHVEGIAAGNTVPMIITVREAMVKGLNMGNYKLYHVEGDSRSEMIYVANADELDAHNEFAYDPATGDLIMALCSFSEVAVVADTENAWEGKFDYTWYDASKTELTIANADQLAAFGAIVGGMNGQTQDSFAGKAVKLIADINLGDAEAKNNPDIIFYPIGYNSSDGKYEKTGVAVTTGFYNFCGTFDGNGHTVSNFYQNTWEMKGDNNYYDATLQYYRDGMGLFGRVYGGTIKNLTVRNFSSDGEYTTTGVIAAYADGATFENIAIFNCNPRVYNIGNGGIVGCVGWYAKEAELKTTFKNITVDNSNKISALWGSYDVACGGIVGQYYPTSGQSSANYPVNAGVHFENCHISAIMDVYNDVCANYQYYAYRYTGMLIGSVRENETIDGHVYPKMDGITAENCTVHFGTWNDYYYCEIIDNTTASYTHDYQMSRLTEIKAINGTTITYLDDTTGTVPASGRANYVIVDYTKGHGTENATCYHFKDGAVWTHDMGGIQTGIDENGDGKDDLKEDKQHIYLEFNNLVTGYGWGVTTKGVGDLAGVTILDRKEGNSVEKFEGKVTELANNKEYKLGDIFTFVDKGVKLVPGALAVSVTNVDENNPVSATFVRNVENWENGTLTLSGTGKVKITIQDYYFCTPTTITVNVTERQPEVKFDVVMNNGDFLHRVGNSGTVPLDKLFKAKDGVKVGTVSVTVEAVNGTAASGTYSNNAIQFSGTGVVKVTITDNEYCTPTELLLEVVDAKNVTSAESATANNVVLLNDCGFSSFEVSGGYTLYGNGFTMTCGSDSAALDMGYSFVTLNNGTLDNVQIVCPNFDYAVLYKSNMTESGNRSETTDKTRYFNVKSGVMVSGNSQILNSRISGARAAVNVTGGNVVIDNSRIELGAVASLLVGSANSLTLRDVTLVQKPTASTYDSSKTLMGFSALFICDADGNTAPVTLEGTLVQNAWVDENDKQYVPSAGQSIISTVLGKTEYLHDLDGDGKKESLNLGFAYMPESLTSKVNTTTITDNRTDKDTVPYDYAEVSILNGKTYVYSYKNTSGTADSFKTESEYKPNKYGDIITITYSESADGLETGKSFGTDGWVYELNVDLDKLPGYKLDFSKLSMSINGVPVTDFTVNGSAKPTSPVAVTAGGVTYTLTATVNGKKCTAELKVTGTETSKESPSKISGPTTAGFGVAKSYGGDWSGAADVLTGVKVKYWSVAENKYIEFDFSNFTVPGNAGKLNSTNNYWEYTHTNNDFTLNVTNTVAIHAGKSVYGMPIRGIDGKLYFTISSTTGYVGSGTDSRSITMQYEFTDNNGGEKLTFTHTFNISYSKDEQYSYSDLSGSGKLTRLESSSGGSNCLAEGTLITLADGSKKAVEDLRKGDLVMAFDHLTGKITYKDVIIVVKTQQDNYYKNTFVFDDGTTLVTINEHGIFDLDLNKYVNIDHENYADYIGHRFVSIDANGNIGTKTLVDVTTVLESGYKYDIVTNGTLNYVAEDTLSVTHVLVDVINSFDFGENLMYDQDKMIADIEMYGLYTYDEWEEYCDISVFDQYNIPVMKVGISKGLYTKEYIIGLINTYVLDDSVQIID